MSIKEVSCEERECQLVAGTVDVKFLEEIQLLGNDMFKSLKVDARGETT